MGTPFVVIEKYAGRTVKLADNNAFCAVYDKGPLVGHQGNGTEINFLFLDVANIGNAGFLVDIVNHQPDGNTDGQFVCHAAVYTLGHIVLYLAETIRHEFKRCASGKILDREYGFKYRLQTDVFTLFRHNINLQESTVRFTLHPYQIGDLNNFPDLAKIFSYTPVCQRHFRHGISIF